MSFCKECGARIPDDSLFCCYCGYNNKPNKQSSTDNSAQVSESPNPQSSGKSIKLISLNCPFCGGQINIEGEAGNKAVFCLHCGRKFMLDDGVNRSEHKKIIIDQAKIQEHISKVELEKLKVDREREIWTGDNKEWIKAEKAKERTKIKEEKIRAKNERLAAIEQEKIRERRERAKQRAKDWQEFKDGVVTLFFICLSIGLVIAMWWALIYMMKTHS